MKTIEYIPQSRPLQLNAPNEYEWTSYTERDTLLKAAQDLKRKSNIGYLSGLEVRIIERTITDTIIHPSSYADL